MIAKILLYFSLCTLAPVALVAQQSSLALTGQQYMRFPIPNRAPFNALGSYRVEFRVHGFTSGAQRQAIYLAYAHNCYLTNHGSLSCDESFIDDGASGEFDLTGRPDVRVRVQRNLSSKQWSFEMWNGDGSGYVVKIVNLSAAARSFDDSASGEGHLGAGPGWGNNWEYATASIAFFRWSSQLMPLGSIPPVESPSSFENMVDFELNGNLTDSSGNRLTGAMSSGSAHFATTPSYAPLPLYSGPTSVRAGVPVTLQAGRSFATAGAGSIVRYAWQQVDGPADADIRSTRSGADALFPVFGTYTLRLTVQDEVGATASADIAIGAVSTDDKGVVIHSDDNVAFLLRPMIQWGQSPWKFFDVVNRADADALGPQPPPLDFGTPLAGTVAIDNRLSGPFRLSGSNTHFKRDFACAGILQNAVSNAATTITVQPGYGSSFAPYGELFIDKELMVISNISGDTLTVVRGGGGTGIVTHDAGSTVRANAYVSVQWNPPGEGGGSGNAVFGVSGCPSDTQLNTDAYYTTIASDTNLGYSRMTGQQMAAFTNFGYGSLGSSYNWNYYDNVLAFYRLYYTTGLTKYRDYARALADKWWLYPLDHGAGSPVPRISGIIGLMLRAMDGRPEMWPGIVHYVSQARDGWLLQSWITGATNWVYDSREIGYTTMFMAMLARVHPDPAVRDQFYGYAKDAVLNYWQPRQAAAGHFPTDNSQLCGGCPTFKGLGAQPFFQDFSANALLFTYQVMTERQDPAASTALQMTQKLVDWLWRTRLKEWRGLYYAVMYDQCPNADSSGFIPCPLDPTGSFTADKGNGYVETWSRSLLNTVINVFGMMYSITGDTKYRDEGDEMFAAVYGGPDGGPGSNTPATGPLSDGKYGEFGDALPPCDIGTPAPCGGNPNPKGAKDWAQAAGAGYAPTYLALRLGGPAPQDQISTAVSFKLADHPNASSIRVTVTQPSGVQKQVTCTNTPCMIPVDGRQSTHTARIEYLSAENKVVGCVKNFRITIPR